MYSSQSAIWRDEGNRRPQLDNRWIWPKLDTGAEPWWFEPRWCLHICSNFQCVLLLDVKSTHYPDQSFSQVHTTRTKTGNVAAIVMNCVWFRHSNCRLPLTCKPSVWLFCNWRSQSCPSPPFLSWWCSTRMALTSPSSSLSSGNSALCSVSGSLILLEFFNSASFLNLSKFIKICWKCLCFQNFSVKDIDW